MPADVNTLHRHRGLLASNPLCRLLLGCIVAVVFTLVRQSDLKAANCPQQEEKLSLPKSEEPASNIAKHKEQLRAYHNVVPAGAATSDYVKDIKVVIDAALSYVIDQAATVKKPAVVLDIDETSLSNWKNIELNDFALIKKGSCSLQADLACGFAAWIQRAEAPKIPPTLEFYNAVRAKNIAVFFVTGRRNSEKWATIRNLKREGFRDWSGLMTRADDDHGLVATFKSGRRALIESNHKDWGYTIIANIGDQDSDLTGGHSGCPFKLPNPFYFIK